MNDYKQTKTGLLQTVRELRKEIIELKDSIRKIKTEHEDLKGGFLAVYEDLGNAELYLSREKHLNRELKEENESLKSQLEIMRQQLTATNTHFESAVSLLASKN